MIEVWYGINSKKMYNQIVTLMISKISQKAKKIILKHHDERNRKKIEPFLQAKGSGK